MMKAFADPDLLISEINKLRDRLSDWEGVVSTERLTAIILDALPAEKYSTDLKNLGNKGGYYGNKILYKNLDLTQDFPNKISFHFLWVKILPKNLSKIFRWPEMCPLG